MSAGTHVAVRTCMGCGTRAPQLELLRISTTCDGTLGVAGRTARGRSGYLHRREDCWERFAARKGLVRSLRRSVDRATRIAFVQGLKQGAPYAMME